MVLSTPSHLNWGKGAFRKGCNACKKNLKAGVYPCRGTTDHYRSRPCYTPRDAGVPEIASRTIAPSRSACCNPIAKRRDTRGCKATKFPSLDFSSKPPGIGTCPQPFCGVKSANVFAKDHSKSRSGPRHWTSFRKALHVVVCSRSGRDGRVFCQSRPSWTSFT